jgi:hypothetical protein
VKLSNECLIGHVCNVSIGGKNRVVFMPLITSSVSLRFLIEPDLALKMVALYVLIHGLVRRVDVVRSLDEILTESLDIDFHYICMRDVRFNVRFLIRM